MIVVVKTLRILIIIIIFTLFSISRTTSFRSFSVTSSSSRFSTTTSRSHPSSRHRYQSHSHHHNVIRMMSHSSSSYDDDNNNDNDNISLLTDWVNHTDVSYHYFTKQEAKDIRKALLDWYRINRRKLPWRGDPLIECNGSTAGINKQQQKQEKEEKENEEKEKKGKQSSITNFFTKKMTSNKSKNFKNKKKKEEQSAAAAVVEPPPPPPTTTTTTIKQEEEEVVGLSSSCCDDSDSSSSIKVSGYGVWVSEIMLQQTRVEAVIPYWIKWMTKFPTIYDLANATEDEVNKYWAGLGFYRRAKLLHNGAKYVVNELNGTIPTNVDDLLKLPGIGKYTASAIASIAFNKPVVSNLKKKSVFVCFLMLLQNSN